MIAMSRCCQTLIAFCVLCFHANGFAAEGAKVVEFYGYDNCIRLSNDRASVTLCPATGGRVLEYSLDGKNMLYLPEGDEGWQYSSDAKQPPMHAGRFDVGPEGVFERGDVLWSGPWGAEVIGARKAEMTSERDPVSGIRLVRKFQLHEKTSQLRCTQTIINESKKTVNVSHRSRTLAVGGGITVIPRSPRGRFPDGYVMYESDNRLDFSPTDPNIQVTAKAVIVSGQPHHPKLGFDSHAGWLAYLAPNNQMFVKRFLTHPDRAYSEFAATTISVRYPQDDSIELQPIGPAETLKPGKQASFIEDWWLVSYDFPTDSKGLDFDKILKKVDGNTTPAGRDPRSIVSPEIHDDGRVTFRFVGSNENVDEVKVVIGKESWELKRDADSVWKYTTDAMIPGWHEYDFQIDGVRVTDPSNRLVKKWLRCKSMFEIVGDDALVTQHRPVPHGTIHRHLYLSKTTGTERAAMIYTPPGYERRGEKSYPLVVLCHGFGDDETAWTEVGRAHHIMDNLIAEGKIQPMVIVMPNGHPVPLAQRTWSEDYNGRNSQAMTDDIVNDLLPLVEHHYNVTSNSENRAIVGLSMGGGHSIMGGMLHPDQFTYVGAFSAAAPHGDLVMNYPQLLQGVQANNATRKLFWIACGEKDFLMDRNREFVEQLALHGINHTFVETEGAHGWSVWRDYLPRFLQLVFR